MVESQVEHLLSFPLLKEIRYIKRKNAIIKDKFQLVRIQGEVEKKLLLVGGWRLSLILNKSSLAK